MVGTGTENGGSLTVKLVLYRYTSVYVGTVTKDGDNDGDYAVQYDGNGGEINGGGIRGKVLRYCCTRIRGKRTVGAVIPQTVVAVKCGSNRGNVTVTAGIQRKTRQSQKSQETAITGTKRILFDTRHCEIVEIRDCFFNSNKCME